MNEGPEPVMVPSPAAVQRLWQDLESRRALYEHELDIDVEDIERAVATGRQDLALSVVREHLDRLGRFQAELHLLVAGAVVEREAEGVLDAVAPRVAQVPFPPLAPSVAAAPVGHQPVARSAGGRRSLASAGSVLLLALLSVLAGGAVVQGGSGAGGSGAATDPLLAVEVASGQAVQAARAAADGAGPEVARLSVLTFDLHSTIVDIDPSLLQDPRVRDRLTVLLSDQQGALMPLAVSMPAAASMLQDVRELATRLELELDPTTPVVTEAPAPAPPAPTDGAPQDPSVTERLGAGAEEPPAADVLAPPSDAPLPDAGRDLPPR